MGVIGDLLDGISSREREARIEFQKKFYNKSQKSRKCRECKRWFNSIGTKICKQCQSKYHLRFYNKKNG